MATEVLECTAKIIWLTETEPSGTKVLPRKGGEPSQTLEGEDLRDTVLALVFHHLITLQREVELELEWGSWGETMEEVGAVEVVVDLGDMEAEGMVEEEVMEEEEGMEEEGGMAEEEDMKTNVNV